jgi:hypothetical protein
MRASSKATKRAVVEEALQLLVQIKGQAGIRLSEASCSGRATCRRCVLIGCVGNA